MLVYVIAFLQPLFYSGANILDNVLTNRSIKNIWSLVCVGSLVNACFLSIALFFGHIHLPSIQTWPWIILVGIIEIAYLFPYYRALKTEDTSIVASLFDIGRIFVPVLAFFFVHEQLTWQMYLGFSILICSSFGISYHHHGPFKLNTAFWNMLLCSLLIAIQSVLYKKIFLDLDWLSGFILPLLITVPIGISLLLFRRIRTDVKQHLKSLKKTTGLYIFDEGLTWAGSAASTYAISQLPVTVVAGINSLRE